VASHVQSLVVVTVNVPTPPSAGAAFSDVSAITWHFVDEGALTATSEELQAVMAAAPARIVVRQAQGARIEPRNVMTETEGPNNARRRRRPCNSVAYAAYG
jgi:hypothetical protein